MGMRSSGFVLACLACTRGGAHEIERLEADTHAYLKKSQRLRSPRDVEKIAGSQSAVPNPARSFATLLLAFVGRQHDLAALWRLHRRLCNSSPLQIVPTLSRSQVLFMRESYKVKPLRRVKVKSLQSKKVRRVKVQGAQTVLVPRSGATRGNSLVGEFSLQESFKLYVAAVTSQQVVFSAMLGGVGNVAAQLAVNGANFDDLKLVPPLSYFLFSTFYSGGFQPNVYRAMDRLFGEDTVKKLGAEFFAYAPFLYIPSFYIVTGVLQGLGFSGSLERLSDLYRDTYLSYILIWPLPMFVYFRWVPVEYRVAYLSTCGFVEKAVYTLLGMKV